jgi:hypothetical protein
VAASSSDIVAVETSDVSACFSKSELTAVTQGQVEYLLKRTFLELLKYTAIVDFAA